MNRIQTLVRGRPSEKRDTLTFGEYLTQLNQWTFNGNAYPTFSYPQSDPKHEEIPAHFQAIVDAAYRSNGIIFACILSRQLLFSEARFQFQRFNNGRPADLFGDPSLSLLEKPWPNGTTGELLVRMEQDVSLAGNFYATTRDVRGRPRIRRMRPDWVTIVMGSYDDPEITGEDLDAEVVGYIYQPKSGYGVSAGKQINLLPEQVCHFSPIPDPLSNFRGMSWLTPVLREIQADSAATSHKLQFFRNGATVNLAIRMDPNVSFEAFKLFKEEFESEHTGYLNAYKTLFLGGGADPVPVGANFQQMDFKLTQGSGETRICAASGVPPIIVGLSEGLAAATYSNFGQARRLFADKWARPQWRQAASALETLVPPPVGARLWFDTRDVAFLQEDEKDRVDIQAVEATSVKMLIDGGFEPKAAVQAVVAGDLSTLAADGAHTGLFSVQLLPPGTTATPASSGTPADPAKPARDASPDDVDHAGLDEAVRVRNQAADALASLREVRRLETELESVRAKRRQLIHRDDDGYITEIEEVLDPAEPETARLAREVARLEDEVSEARARRRRIIHRDENDFITEIEDVCD